MKVLLVNEREVHALLTMEACIPLMREALATLARGDAVLPLRTKVGLPDGLSAVGIEESHVHGLARLAMEDACHQMNPRAVTEHDLEHLYRASL